MTRISWAVIAFLIAALALAVAFLIPHDVDTRSQQRADLLAMQNDSLKVELAISKTSLVRADTVWRRAKARIDTLRLRDTVPPWRHDTTYVAEYVTRTDSALQACSELANLCQRYRTTAERLISSQGAEIVVGREVGAANLRRAQRAERFTIGAFVVGVALGAWVRGR